MNNDAQPNRAGGSVIVATGIAIHPDIMGGMACVAGTRLPVCVISDLARDGLSCQAIKREYPGLSYEQIANALAWQIQPLSTRKSRIGDARQGGGQ